MSFCSRRSESTLTQYKSAILFIVSISGNDSPRSHLDTACLLTSNISANVYSSKVESFTHNKVYDIIVSKQYLSENDRILIIDDFLAVGNALKGLIALVNAAGASVAGAGIVIEKAFQNGGKLIRDMGIRVESLAKIREMSDDSVFFE